MTSIAQKLELDDTTESHPQRMQLKWFNGTKGFGFVIPEDKGYDAFIHVTTLQQAGLHSIGEGALLLCTLFDGPKGKQVKEILEVVDKGSFSTVPEENPEDGTITMGGLIKWYKPDKGFGFIIPDDGQKDVFVHQTRLEELGIEELRAGQRVRITVRDVDKGREAINIEMEE